MNESHSGRVTLVFALALLCSAVFQDTLAQGFLEEFYGVFRNTVFGDLLVLEQVGQNFNEMGFTGTEESRYPYTRLIYYGGLPAHPPGLPPAQ